MERGRVPLPAPRDALPHVDPSGGDRPRRPACADARVDLLLRCGQPAHRQVRAHLLSDIQRRHLRGIPPGTTPLPVAPQEDGGCARQRPLPPRQTPPAAAVGAPPASGTALSSALQSATRAHRAGLEADAPISDAQLVLRQLGPIEGSGRPLF